MVVSAGGRGVLVVLTRLCYKSKKRYGTQSDLIKTQSDKKKLDDR